MGRPVAPPPVRITAAASDVKAPTAPMGGSVTYDGNRGRGLFRYRSQVDTGEYVPELLDHQSAVREYEQMVTKTHLASLIRATKLALEKLDFHVTQGPASERVTDIVAANLGLPVGRDGQAPPAGGLDFGWLLSLINDAPLFAGHAYAEMQAGPSPVFPGATWLTALEARPQNTLTANRVARDGSLLAVEQQGFDDPRPVEIPRDRLAAFVYNPRPGDWWGKPIIRDCWESEYYRGVNAKIDAQANEFGGVGVAQAEWLGGTDVMPTDTQIAMAEDALANYRGGGAMIVAGFRISVIAPGATRDVLGSMKHWEQKSSAAFMAGVMELGTTGQGNRALGDVLDDHWKLGIYSIAGWACRQINAELVRPLVDWNEGPDAPAPVVEFYAGDEVEISLTDLKAGVESKAVVLTPDLIRTVHKRAGYPEPSAEEIAAYLAPTPSVPEVAVTAAAAGDFRRQLRGTEVTAAVNFQGLDTAFTKALAALVGKLRPARAKAAAALVDQTKGAGQDLAKLAAITAGPVGLDALTVAALDHAQHGAEHAVEEAAAQGVKGASSTLDDQARKATEARAQAQALTLGGTLDQSARGRALAAVAEGIDDVAAAVADHLDTLTDAALSDAATATLTGALGEGRQSGQRSAFGIFRRKQKGTVRIIGSALLDKNACSPCVADDGREFTSIEEANQVYPGGSHNVACQGRGRCRCLTYQVFDTEGTRA